MQLVIGNKNYSSWSLRPWLLMKHFCLSFEEIHVPLFSSEMPELMDKYCPNKKVPTLHDGDCVIWDSLAICEYINEQYLNGKGYPNDGRQRAVARSLTCEMHSGFMMIRSQMSMDIRVNDKNYDKNNTELVEEIQRIDDIFSGAKGEFLFGNFGIVDCFFAPVAFRCRTFNVPLSDKAKTYQQTLLTLPEMQEWECAARKETAILDL